MIKSNVCCTTRASSQYLLFIRTNKTISARAPWTAPPVVMLHCWTIWLQKCILVEVTSKFVPVIALQYHWHYGRDGFAAVNPQTRYKEKENQAKRPAHSVRRGDHPELKWSCRVPNSDNKIFFSFPSSLALVRFSLPPLLQYEHRQCARCVSPWATSGGGTPGVQPVHPRAGSDHLPMETHSCTNLWGAQLKKALKNLFIQFSRLQTKPWWKGGKKHPPPDILYGPWVLTVACVPGCSPAICAHKQWGGLESVTLICIGDHIPVLFTTVFLFPETITLLVEKVDLSTSCLKLFVYQKWVLHNLCQCLNKEQSWSS